MVSRRWLPDLLSSALLLALCGLFYWRLLTPNALDQVSLVEGDFSGQFVAFAHYQAQRLGAGEVPLWNPYNLGGHPFLADTQSAVFYPPRLISIAALNLTGGSTPQRMYAALQAEVVAHALIGSLLMYAFCRALIKTRYSVPAALIGALTFAYGGFLTGYAPLQLAIMEAAVWLPLALLGILRATETERVQWIWLAVSGVALGVALLAGHPQTALYFIYTSLAYLAWRSFGRAQGKLRTFVIGALLFGVIGGGMAAVQLLHGWEYLSATTRGALSFEAKGNGFPFYDLLQVVLPSVFSLYSPLYFGVAALMLLIYSLARLRAEKLFWLGALLIALGLSLGKNAVFYDLFYQLVPGFNLFRQQERAAYIVAIAAAVLAAHGAADILEVTEQAALARRYTLIFFGIAVGLLILSCALLIAWLAAPETFSTPFQRVMFSALVALSAALLLSNLAVRNAHWQQWRSLALVALIGIELFSFGRANPNFESIPVANRLREPSALAVLRAHAAEQPFFRVDGVRENFGTLYNVPDIQGISPLRFAHVERILKLPNRARVWQLFGVRYVITADRELPMPSRVIYEEENPYNPVRLHVLADALPLARVMHRAWLEPDEMQALGYLSDPAYDAAHTVLLPSAPPVALSGAESAPARLVQLLPERWLIEAETETAALLRVALVYDANWLAYVNGVRVPLLRADIAFSAVPIPAGKSTIEFIYQPTSYALGAAITLSTVLALGAGGFFRLAHSIHRRARRRN